MNVAAAAKAFNDASSRNHWGQSCDPSLAFRDPEHRRLLAIWRAKAGTRKMPARSEMTARDLKDFLRNIVLLQREIIDGVPHYRWRLIGTGVTGVLGHNTGKLLDDTVPGEHLGRWNEVANLILESQQPLRFVGRVQIEDRDYLRGENLYLPLADDAGVPAFVLAHCRYVPWHQDNEMSEDELASQPQALL